MPHLAAVVIEELRQGPNVVRLQARVRSVQALCPRCGQVSVRVHSRYRRRLADAPISGRPVELDLLVRRFFCDSSRCPARTFVEQVAGLTTPHARRTGLLRTMWEAIGLALAGRAGARLALCLGLVTNRNGLLRLVRALPDPPVDVVEVLGVDDFALRRGHVYGTVVLDMATHRPIDLLGDRTADTLAAWLREHPGVQVVCRDRAGAYAEGIRAGAPDALQVADRWHLWHKLTEAVEKTVIRHRADLHEPDQAAPEGSTDPRNDAAGSEVATDVAPRETRIVVRTRERYAAVQQNLAAGATLSAICRALRLDRKTVQRFARTTSVDELLVKSQTRDSLLDTSSPTCTSAGTPAAATPLHSPSRSLRWATAAATRPSAATCAPSAPRSSSRRRDRPRRQSGRPPAG